MVTYTIKNYQPEMLESWLRCRALAYMRSSFQDEITAEKETVSDDTGVSLVAIKDQQVIGMQRLSFWIKVKQKQRRMVFLKGQP